MATSSTSSGDHLFVCSSSSDSSSDPSSDSKLQAVSSAPTTAPITANYTNYHIFQTFTPIAETKFKTKICDLYSDNGGEFRGIGFHQNLSWIMVELCGLFRFAPSQLSLRSWGLIHALQVLSELSAVEITSSMVAAAFHTREIGEGSRLFELLPRISPDDPAESTTFLENLLNLATNLRDPAFLLHPDIIQMTSLASSDSYLFVPARNGYLFCFIFSCLNLLHLLTN
uniref:Uncharacterized protein n=1 Tax=Brassica oleracea TaxID=3712 RepID=A0A3P6FV11_BRAOL|nr:unnamed protein product [Brassica oleracea]